MGILGTFNFLVLGGAKIFGRVAKGEKFWTCHLGGGRTFLDFEFFGILYRENKGTHIKLFA